MKSACLLVLYLFIYLKGFIMLCSEDKAYRSHIGISINISFSQAEEFTGVGPINSLSLYQMCAIFLLPIRPSPALAFPPNWVGAPSVTLLSSFHSHIRTIIMCSALKAYGSFMRRIQRSHSSLQPLGLQRNQKEC